MINGPSVRIGPSKKTARAAALPPAEVSFWALQSRRPRALPSRIHGMAVRHWSDPRPKGRFTAVPKPELPPRDSAERRHHVPPTLLDFGQSIGRSDPLTCVNAAFSLLHKISSMKRPVTGMAFEPERHLTFARIAGFALVIALHIGFVYALITGLAMHVVLQLPQELLAQVVAAPPPTPQPPPLTPNLDQPSLPTVTPPMIRIDQSQASTHSITAYVGLPTPPTQSISAAPAWTPAVAIEKTHTIPPYPMSARRLNQQGTVRLSLTVSPDGNVSDISVIVSSGTPALDDVALAWVKSHWRYKPATKDGHAVAATVHAIVIFDLKNA